MAEPKSYDVGEDLSYDDLPEPLADGLENPDALSVDGDNPNEMSDEMFGLLVRRMKQNGWLGGPIITDADGLIADGEHRWRAARELGLDRIPVRRYDIADDTRRLWRQELNKIHGHHDKKRDALEYDFLIDHGRTDEVLELTEARGEDLDELLASIRVQSKKRPGYDYPDEHNVHFEDCIDGMARRLADESVGCVITDPPYGMDFQSGMKGWKPGDRVKQWPEIEGDHDLEDALELIEGALREIRRVPKEGAHVYLFCDWRNLHAVRPLADEYLTVKNVIVWDKGSMGIGDLNHNWGYSHEFVLFCTKGDQAQRLPRAHRNLIREPRENRVDYHHPTEKPLDLIRTLVEYGSEEGDLVLDPFLGSGTTAVAAILTNREYLAFEIQEDWREPIEKRIAEAYRQVGFDAPSNGDDNE